MSGWRLSTGGRLIDRSRPLDFEFNGRPRQGLSGDTLASALMAQGEDVLARSFKYHRPRGVSAAGWEEPCAFVGLQAPRSEPNVLATTEPLVAGLRAVGQQGWPAWGVDPMAWADVLHRWLPAGFYYKAFKSPSWAWPWFERALRHAAGLGHMPDQPLQDSAYERRFAHAEVLVVGVPQAGAAVVKAFKARGKVDAAAVAKAKKGEGMAAKMDAFDAALEAYFGRS
jgi:sarcosine oxidase subunit alpha